MLCSDARILQETSKINLVLHPAKLSNILAVNVKVIFHAEM